jgi:simple sugar transport system permease protein
MAQANIKQSATSHKLSKLSILRLRLAKSPELVALITLLLVFIFFAVSAPDFLSAYALSNILTFASVNGIVVAGITFLMISGELDLSVGSNLAVAGFIFLLTLLAGVPPFLGMLLALVVASLLGLINGLIVVHSGIPSFIATLGTLLAYRGLAQWLGGGRANAFTPEVKPGLFAILNAYLTPINNLFDPAGNFRVSSVWFIGIVAVMSIVLMRTRHGNATFAIGGNPGAALAQGINVTRLKLINFTLSGFFAGLAGVILFAQRSSMNQLLGEGLELTAIAAAVIGGVALNGGSGTIIGAALGMILLTLLEQGLVLMGVSNVIFEGIVGAIIILSVVINLNLKRQ